MSEFDDLLARLDAGPLQLTQSDCVALAARIRELETHRQYHMDAINTKSAAMQNGQTPPLTAGVTSAASQEAPAVGSASAAALIPGLERAAEICHAVWEDAENSIRAEIEKLTTPKP